jgi:hypothetical protein
MRAMDHHPMAPGESRLTARLTCLETRLVKGSSQLSKSGLVFCPKSKVTSSMLGPVSTLLPSLVTQWCLCLILILKTWTSSKGFVFASWEDHLSFFLDCLMLDLTEGPVPWSSWHIAMVTTGKRLCLSSSLLTQAPLLQVWMVLRVYLLCSCILGLMSNWRNVKTSGGENTHAVH